MRHRSLWPIFLFLRLCLPLVDDLTHYTISHPLLTVLTYFLMSPAIYRMRKVVKKDIHDLALAGVTVRMTS